MKRLGISLFVLNLFISINSNAQATCQSFFQYTLGLCPDVAFFDGSTSSPGTLLSWAYDFGDGGISTSQNPVHTYTANGSYVVCLTIITSDFCTSTYCDTVTVNCITATSCDASFTYNLAGCPDVLFTDASTSSPGTIISWLYSFGDGGTSTTQGPTHTYLVNGSYVACLVIVTSDGCTSTYCDTIDINCISPSSCDAAYSYTLGGCPDVAFFDASTSSPGTIISWLYSFGDGGTSTAQNPTHTYLVNGSYVACLVIVTSDGCTSTYCDTITINCITLPSCIAYFQFDLGACPNAAFTDFSMASPGVVDSWFYSFGDGGTSSLQNPNHTYPINGTYVACLVITTSDGCAFTYCDTIVVNCAVGLDEPELTGMTLSPNPVNDEFRLVLETPSPFSFELVNTLGTTILEGRRSISDEQNFNVSNLSRGTYFIKVYIDGREQVLKLFKQ